MIDISKIHLATAKAVKNHGIDYTKFETIEQLRAEIKIHRDKKHREKWKDAIRVYMVEKYRANPEKCRVQRTKTRQQSKERDPEAYAEKIRVYRRTHYAKIKAEKFKLLEIPEVNPPTTSYIYI
tara:strand:- start:917 stop:1288 length:372 start_codon:yes stop_codon:yes gene_type:complete